MHKWYIKSAWLGFGISSACINAMIDMDFEVASAQPELPEWVLVTHQRSTAMTMFLLKHSGHTIDSIIITEFSDV
jgi:hypothetical protein